MKIQKKIKKGIFFELILKERIISKRKYKKNKIIAAVSDKSFPRITF